MIRNLKISLWFQLEFMAYTDDKIPMQLLW